MMRRGDMHQIPEEDLSLGKRLALFVLAMIFASLILADDWRDRAYGLWLVFCYALLAGVVIGGLWLL